MTTPSVEVLADRIENLCVRLDEGITRIEHLFEAHGDDLEKHKDWDMTAHAILRAEVSALRTDIEVFKARWSMLAVVASTVISGVVSLLLKYAL